MTTKRKTHSKQFKFRVTLEAAKNRKTNSQVASDFEVHPSQVGKWKKELMQKGPDVFENQPKKADKQAAAKETELYEQIGRLKMDLEWLKKKVG